MIVLRRYTSASAAESAFNSISEAAFCDAFIAMLAVDECAITLNVEAGSDWVLPLLLTDVFRAYLDLADARAEIAMLRCLL